MDENTCRKQGNRWIIQYDSQNFRSLSAFCKAYEVSEFVVKKSIIDGASPQEALDHANNPQSKRGRPTRESRGGYIYQGEEFESLAAASRILSVPMHYFYELQKKRTCPREEFLDYAMEHLPEIYKEHRVNCKPCIIDGVRYRSQKAACDAYHIPWSTVAVKMNKKRLSFEEAFDSSIHNKSFVKPLRNHVQDYEFMTYSSDDEFCSTIADAIGSVGVEKFHFLKTNDEELVLYVEIYSRVLDEFLCFYVVFHKQSTSTVFLVEIICYDLIDLEEFESETIKDLDFVGVTTTTIDEAITISSLQLIENSKRWKLLSYLINMFLYTCELVVLESKKNPPPHIE